MKLLTEVLGHRRPSMPEEPYGLQMSTVKQNTALPVIYPYKEHLSCELVTDCRRIPVKAVKPFHAKTKLLGVQAECSKCIKVFLVAGNQVRR